MHHNQQICCNIVFLINYFTRVKYPLQRHSTVTHRLTHRFFFFNKDSAVPAYPHHLLNPLKHHQQDAKQQFTIHTTHPTASSKNPPLPSSLILLCCFPWGHVVSKAQLMNSRQLVGLKFIDRTAMSQPAFLPGCVALIVQSVRSICYWAALLAWQQRAGSITSIAWWLRREQRGHAC